MTRALLVATLVGVVVLVASPDAQAKQKKSCARAIINDWYGDGQIDKQYEPHCYKEAIRALPVDIKDYSHAPEDILRALAYRKLGKPDPGNGGIPGSPSNPNSAGDPHQQTGPDTTSTDSNGEGTLASPDDGLDTSSPSSIPIPLLVLGGLAVLLLAAGGAGYINRRRLARGTDNPGP